MKKTELFFSTMFIPVDFAMLILAGLSAYYLRFSEWTISWRPVIFDLPMSEYFRSLLIISVLWIVIFALSGLYQIRSARKLAQEIQRIIVSCSAGFALVSLIIFFQRDLFDSRFIVLAGFVFSIIYLSFFVCSKYLVRRPIFT